MKWRTYPNYKDSGVEWLGEIPEHWEARRLKYIASLNDETLGETTNPDFQLLYVDISGVDAIAGIQHKEKLVFGDAPSRARRKVRHGDVIVSTVRTYLRAIAPVVEPEANLIVSTGFAVVRPMNELESQFALYALRAPYFVEEVVANSVGVSYPAINTSELATFFVALPPQDEQRAIAAFLDRETERIDALIARKERQVELLQEKRAALISHAVTKGLDPNAPMKDSGVEWLGEIPAHWEAKRLKRLIKGRLVNGLFKKKQHFGSGMKLVNVFDVYRDDFLVDFESLDRVEANESEQSKYAVHDGDIFFVRSSLKLEGVGRSVCAFGVTEPTVFECHVVRARPNQTVINPKFLVNFLNSVYAINRLIALSNMVTMATIDQGRIKSLEIPVPPLAEQNEIMELLEHEIGNLAVLKKRINETIAKLREYRAALISAAVTGKMDVRQGGYDGL